MSFLDTITRHFKHCNVAPVAEIKTPFIEDELKKIANIVIDNILICYPNINDLYVSIYPCELKYTVNISWVDGPNTLNIRNLILPILTEYNNVDTGSGIKGE